MSDTPFSDNTSSTADVVTAVDFTGTTLTLTKQASDDLTTTISSTPQVVSGLTYNAENDDKLKLTQTAGQASFEVTIPSGAPEVSFMAFWNANTTYNSSGLEVFIPSHEDSNVGSPEGYGWDLTEGEFKCHTDTEGLYYFCFNVQMILSESLRVQAQKNDVDVNIEGFQVDADEGVGEIISVAGVIRLAHNDTFRFVKVSGFPTTLAGFTRSRIFGFRINE